VRIDFIGAKGIPATFGGVEHHLERLATELARLGHEVRVYVRTWYTPAGLRLYRGVRLVHLPTVRTKHADASVHSFLASVRAAVSGADIVHYHAIGPGSFSVLPRLAGKKTVVTVHRLDWQTDKWGPVARLMLKAGELVSARVPHRTVVVSAELKRRFRDKWGRDAVLIPHGRAVVEAAPPRLIRARHGLRGRDYILFLGRLSPEKRVEWLIDSFLDLKGTEPRARRLKLVVAGGSSATDSYVRRLKASGRGNRDVVFTGYVAGREKAELLANALILVLPSSLEGYPVVLEEAAGFGLCRLASDIPPHREAIETGKDGLLFRRGDRADLTRCLARLIARPALASRLGRAARARASRTPGWDEIARRHEKLYNEIVRKARIPVAPASGRAARSSRAER
jgi:glycosyltransferase involved in cell wall biosynthesis